jgi:hypothetical protein
VAAEAVVSEKDKEPEISDDPKPDAAKVPAKEEEEEEKRRKLERNARKAVLDCANDGLLSAEEAGKLMFQMARARQVTRRVAAELNKTSQETLLSPKLRTIMIKLMNDALRMYIEARVEAGRTYADRDSSMDEAAKFLMNEAKIAGDALGANDIEAAIKALRITCLNEEDEVAEVRMDFSGELTRHVDPEMKRATQIKKLYEEQQKKRKLEEQAGTLHIITPDQESAIDKLCREMAQIELHTRDSAERKHYEETFKRHAMQATEGFWLKYFNWHEPDPEMAAKSGVKDYGFMPAIPYELPESFEWNLARYPIYRHTDSKRLVPLQIRCLDEFDLVRAIHPELHDIKVQMELIEKDVLRRAQSEQERERAYILTTTYAKAAQLTDPVARKAAIEEGHVKSKSVKLMKSPRSVKDLVQPLMAFWTTAIPMLMWSLNMQQFYVAQRRMYLVRLGQLVYEIGVYDAMCSGKTRCTEPSVLLDTILDSTFDSWTDYVQPRSAMMLGYGNGKSGPTLRIQPMYPVSFSGEGIPVNSVNARDARDAFSKEFMLQSAVFSKAFSRGIQPLEAASYRLIRAINEALIPIVMNAFEMTDLTTICYYDYDMALSKLQDHKNTRQSQLFTSWIVARGSTMAHFDHMTLPLDPRLKKEAKAFLDHPRKVFQQEEWSAARFVYFDLELKWRVGMTLATHVCRKGQTFDPPSIISEYLCGGLNDMLNEWTDLHTLISNNEARHEGIDAYYAVPNHYFTDEANGPLADHLTARIKAYMNLTTAFADQAFKTRGIQRTDGQKIQTDSADTASLLRMSQKWLASGGRDVWMPDENGLDKKHTTTTQQMAISARESVEKAKKMGMKQSDIDELQGYAVAFEKAAKEEFEKMSDDNAPAPAPAAAGVAAAAEAGRSSKSTGGGSANTVAQSLSIAQSSTPVAAAASAAAVALAAAAATADASSNSSRLDVKGMSLSSSKRSAAASASPAAAASAAAAAAAGAAAKSGALRRMN